MDGRTVRLLSAMAASTGGKCLIVLTGLVVSRMFASWNQLAGWLRQVEALRRAAGGASEAHASRSAIRLRLRSHEGVS